MRRSLIPFAAIVVSASIAAGLAIATFPNSTVWSGAAVAVFLLGILLVAGLREAKFRTPPRSRAMSVPIAIFVTLLFVVGTIVSWQFDFRDRHFFDTGWVVVAYNAWRLVTLGFLLVIFRGYGFPLRRYFERRYGVPLAEGVFEQAVLDATIGAAILIILMFVAGLLGLYYRPAVLAVAAVGCGLGLHASGADHAKASSIGSIQRYAAIAQRGLAAILVPIVVGLIGLTALGRISAEYDASHYLPYYEEVVANHGTAINDYWYHFWVSKGAGLQFFAVSLGDVFSASLASSALLVLCGGWVFAFVRRVVPEDRSLALAAVLAFFTPFLFDFPYQQKEHFVVMELLMGALWVFAWMCQPRSATLRPGLAIVTLIAAAVVVCSTPSAAILGLWFGVLALGLFVRLSPKQCTVTDVAMACMPAATVAGVAIAILLLNQRWVGMAEVTPFRFFFAHADQHRLSHYISPYLVLFLEEVSPASTGRVIWENLIHPDFVKLLDRLRFNALPFGSNVLLGALCLGVATMVFKSVRERLGWPAFCAGALLLVAALVSLLVSQPASLFRFYIFSLPLIITILAVCLVAVIRLVSLRWNKFAHVAVPVMAVVLGIYVASVNMGTFAQKSIPTDFNKQMQFIGGNRSLAETIGIIPTCTKMAHSFGNGASTGHAMQGPVRIWTLTFLLPVGCYLLPHARVLMEMSVSFGPQWHRIVFGPADAARRALKKMNIRYFYVDLADFDPAKPSSASTSLMGCLAYSPLFAPSAIPKYFRVVWRDQDAFLLVLADSTSEGTPVPDDFIRRWPGKRDKFQYGLGQMQQLCERVAGYYHRYGEHWPVQTDPALPKLKGWQ